MRESGISKASEAWREAVDAGDRPTGSDPWVRVEDVRAEATAAVGRAKRHTAAGPMGDAAEPVRRQRKTTPAVAEELAKVAGTAQAPKLGQRLAEATRAFECERYAESRSVLKTLAERAPGSAAVRELYGLTLYRLGQWKLAQRELEAFATIAGSTEQHPVLADCARALGRPARVEELWQELREASPSAELVTEGRIVAAGSLADQGKLREAIELLEQGFKSPKRPKEHHLRLLYALGDLRERAGEIPAARTLFRRIADADPGFADIASRLRAL
ncbi:MAG: tetratricopeptide repeat protein [Acidimicrobiales bacterium]